MKEADCVKWYFEELAKRHGWKIKNLKLVDAMIRNFKNGRRMFLFSCPCQNPETREIICPCDRFLKTGKCVCGMFYDVDKKVSK